MNKEEAEKRYYRGGELQCSGMFFIKRTGPALKFFRMDTSGPDTEGYSESVFALVPVTDGILRTAETEFGKNGKSETCPYLDRYLAAETAWSAGKTLKNTDWNYFRAAADGYYPVGEIVSERIRIDDEMNIAGSYGAAVPAYDQEKYNFFAGEMQKTALVNAEKNGWRPESMIYADPYKISYAGIDSFGRPVFTLEDSGLTGGRNREGKDRRHIYIGSAEDLFSSGGTEKDVLSYFENRPEAKKNLEYFGKTFGCEPDGRGRGEYSDAVLLPEKSANLWRGVPEVKVLQKGSGKDPLLEYRGKKKNARDVENAVYRLWLSEAGNPEADFSRYDRKSPFPSFCRAHAEYVYREFGKQKNIGMEMEK